MSALYQFKDGDGEDTDICLENLHIEPVSNGYIINYSYDDGSEIKEVYINKQEMLDFIKGIL